MKVYLEQLERLAALDARLALPAHGEPIDAPSTLFRRYVAHRLMREAKVLAAVAGHGAEGARDDELLPAAGLHQLAVTADLVPDKDRLVKNHAVDRHRRASPVGALCCQGATGEIHLGKQPPAEYIAVGVGVGRHRHPRTSGAAAGNSSGDRGGALSLVDFIILRPTG